MVQSSPAKPDEAKDTTESKFILVENKKQEPVSVTPTFWSSSRPSQGASTQNIFSSIITGATFLSGCNCNDAFNFMAVPLLVSAPFLYRHLKNRIELKRIQEIARTDKFWEELDVITNEIGSKLPGLLNEETPLDWEEIEILRNHPVFIEAGFGAAQVIYEKMDEHLTATRKNLIESKEPVVDTLRELSQLRKYLASVHRRIPERIKTLVYYPWKLPELDMDIYPQLNIIIDGNPEMMLADQPIPQQRSSSRRALSRLDKAVKNFGDSLQGKYDRKMQSATRDHPRLTDIIHKLKTRPALNLTLKNGTSLRGARVR